MTQQQTLWRQCDHPVKARVVSVQKDGTVIRFCARCGRPVHPVSHHDNLGTWSDIERDEYWITALCSWCQSDVEKMLPDE